jgi:asparagine synthase (glutamine-hydrolysing)
MCGIAGIAAIGGDLGPDARMLLRTMSRAVAHRGPDGERIEVDGSVGFAFRRLALVDPAHGDQPLFDTSGLVALIANGEVYNDAELRGTMPDARFVTRSDCEVLAHLYAARQQCFLDDVRGMFAIALHDRRRRRLVLARDRFGIKPLYFVQLGPVIAFASEIKALLSLPDCPRELDWNSALSDQLVHGAPVMSFDGLNCWFRGIEYVAPGTVLTIDLADGSRQCHTYWQLPDFTGTDAASDRELVASYRDLLANSVDECASADAEVGLFLSGGIDSAAVAALAAEAGHQVHTFTVRSASTAVNGDADAAGLVAATLGLRNDQVVFSSDQVPSADEWRRLLWLLETPLCSPAQYYTYQLHAHARRTRPDLKGMMLGQASDEFNGGYSGVMPGAQDWPGFEAVLGQFARTTALQQFPALFPWQSHAGASPITGAVAGERRFTSDAYPDFIRWKYRDIQQYNCWHEDRTAAGNGIEARVPFLDHRIIELMSTIPRSRRPGLLWDKAILRAAVAGILPDEIATRPKVSFYHGDGSEHTHRVFLKMLMQDDCALVEEALASKGGSDYLNGDVMRAWLGDLYASRKPDGIEYFLRLINLGLLDAMTREIPLTLTEQPVCLRTWDVRRGEEAIEDTALSCGLAGTRFPEMTDQISLAPDVELVQSVTDESVLYLAVNGQFEFVIERADAPEWYSFLRGLRAGEERLGDVLRRAAVELTEIEPFLRDCVVAGLVLVEPGQAARGVEAAT